LQMPSLSGTPPSVDAIRISNTPPPVASRNLAIAHLAIYDAVNGIRRTHEPYLVTGNVASSASVDAAAAAAGYSVFGSLYPALRAEAEALYSSLLASIKDGPQKQAGIAWGQHVAGTLLEVRRTDGSDKTVVYIPGTNPGAWQPTISFAGIVRPALLPQWGSVTPFGIRSVVPFRPPDPPLLTTAQYAADVNQVQSVGGLNSATRTPEQTEIARFWGYGPGTATPPGHWNQIAQETAFRQRNTLEENARLFALLNMALADAAIVSWDCKYTFNLWRPITAIQRADLDGNPNTSPDPSWTPLLPTPPFPEYTSGHSTFSAAAAVVLASFHHTDNVPFAVGSDDLPGVVRHYNSFSQAALESGMSRIFGGIHFMSANVNGLSSGAALAEDIVFRLLTPKDNRSRK
jgi:hypothetical protein